MAKRTKYIAIQNEETLLEVAHNGGDYFIECIDKQDAHSKQVSLNNAKRKLTTEEQLRVRIQKKKDTDGIWGVRIYAAELAPIFKLVDGVKVPWNPNEEKLSYDAERMLKLMIEDGVPTEQILAQFSDIPEDQVRARLNALRPKRDLAAEIAKT